MVHDLTCFNIFLNQEENEKFEWKDAVKVKDSAIFFHGDRKKIEY